MASQPQNLRFDIDTKELIAIADQLEATEAQLEAAYNRALKRTAVTVRSLSNKLIRDKTQAKSLKAIRKRFQHYRLTSSRFDELKLWFGLNEMSVGALKGRHKRLGTKKKPKGAMFTPKGDMGAQTYDDGFVARLYNRRSIFARKGERRFPVKEARVPISDALHVAIEDEIFDQLPEIFLRHFESDLKGRTKMGLNKEGWRG
ncbi:phage tail protein [Enterovibrio norvegicus]|uniref:phage tail protein n=1 Tax=Enterovibrio norvegicus TaxID=188144 RepID=UPI0035545EAD